jgi:hypothetical protein
MIQLSNSEIEPQSSETPNLLCNATIGREELKSINYLRRSYILKCTMKNNGTSNRVTTVKQKEQKKKTNPNSDITHA